MVDATAHLSLNNACAPSHRRPRDHGGRGIDLILSQTSDPNTANRIYSTIDTKQSRQQHEYIMHPYIPSAESPPIFRIGVPAAMPRPVESHTLRPNVRRVKNRHCSERTHLSPRSHLVAGRLPRCWSVLHLVVILHCRQFHAQPSTWVGFGPPCFLVPPIPAPRSRGDAHVGHRAYSHVLFRPPELG